MSAAAPLPDHVYRAMVESTVSPFVLVDRTGTIRWVSPRVEALLGHSAADFVGRNFLDTIAPSDHEAAIASFTGFVGGEDEAKDWIAPPMVLDLLHADGSIVACELSASLGTPADVDGAFVQIRRARATPLLYDAIDALAGGAALPTVLEQLAELCELETPGTDVAIGTGWDGVRFRTLTQGARARKRPGLSSLLDVDAPTPWHTAMQTGSLEGPADLTRVNEALRSRAAELGYRTCWTLPVARGTEHSPSAALVLWRDVPGPSLPHLVTTASRVGRLVTVALEADEHRGRLRQAARTDELTGLANRTAQRQLLDDLTSRATEECPVTVLFCDLDGFKPVNDEHGHGIGDRVLYIVAERLRGSVRNSEEIARWGGDEFVIVSTLSDHDEIRSLAERLIAHASAPVRLGDLSVHVGLSIGSATTTEVIDPDTLVQAADKALLEAKHLGPNAWRHAIRP